MREGLGFKLRKQLGGNTRLERGDVLWRLRFVALDMESGGFKGVLKKKKGVLKKKRRMLRAEMLPLWKSRGEGTGVGSITGQTSAAFFFFFSFFVDSKQDLRSACRSYFYPI